MNSIERILFPTDFSERAARALEHAVQLAIDHSARLDLLHVDEHSDRRGREDKVAGNEEQLGAVKDRVLSISDRMIEVDTSVRTGEAAAPAIVDFARQSSADLIVIGTHGRRGVSRVFLGSVAEEVVRTAPCPVLSVRTETSSPPPRPMRRVLVPIDFSEYGALALNAADRFVVDDAEIIILHAVEDFVPPGVYGLEYPSYHQISADAEASAREEMRRMADSILSTTRRTDIDIARGYAPSAIVDYATAREVDAIVMSTHGRTGIERMLLGSVAERVLRTSDLPVLIVRSFPQKDSAE
ncbi:MAG: universal stress protein [Bacteroidota bacterium]